MNIFHPNLRSTRRRRSLRSFTLVELLISVAMIALLASTALFALYGAAEQARAVRTRAQVVRLHELLMEEWEGYRTRAIRLTGVSRDPRVMATARLSVLRQLMRMELPDRVTDVSDTAATGTIASARWKSYVRSVVATLGTNWYMNPQPQDGQCGPGKWSYTHQGSECLFLIVSMIRTEDTAAIEFFQHSEIGDTDGDGMNEILDGWGRPIEFLRWAPGYATDPGPDGFWGQGTVDDDGDNTTDEEDEIGAPSSDDRSSIQPRDSTTSPDPFDPLHINSGTYALFPLIFSAGKDGVYGIESEFDTVANNTMTHPVTNQSVPAMDMFRYKTVSNDPYYVSSQSYLGRPSTTALDNITNHTLDSE